MNNGWGSWAERYWRIKIGLPGHRKIRRRRHLQRLRITWVCTGIRRHQRINQLIAIGVSGRVVKNQLIIVTQQHWRVIGEARATVVTSACIWARNLRNKGKSGVIGKLQIGNVWPPTTTLVRNSVAPWNGWQRQNDLINRALNTNSGRLGSAWIVEING